VFFPVVGRRKGREKRDRVVVVSLRKATLDGDF